MALDPLTSAYLNDRNTQIGNICFQWAHMEYILALAIWSMLRIDSNTGKIITGGLDILPRVNMAISLAELLKAPKHATEALKACRSSVQHQLIDRRNRAIHGLRSFDPNKPDTEFVEVHRGKNAGKKLAQTNADLAKLGTEIAAVHTPLLQALLSSGVLYAKGVRPAPIISQKGAHKMSPNSKP